MSKQYTNKTGKHWYNNGVVQLQAAECPEGFQPGRLPIAESTKEKISKSLMGHPSALKGIPKSEESKRKMSETRKARKIPAWNKGLTAATDERVKINTDKCHETRRQNNSYVAWNKGLTQETDDRVKLNHDHKVATMLKKYGVPNPSLRDIPRTAWNKGLTADTDERVQKASENHRGVSAWNRGLKCPQTEEQRISRNDKRFATKRANGTLNSSKAEEIFYATLCDKYGSLNVLRQYKDERYPFACDFYIPSEDLFIELNLHWTHGGRPYDSSSNECQEKLETWKEKAKTSSYYRLAVYVWTKLDVRKQTAAHDNNLNYKTIYKLDN